MPKTNIKTTLLGRRVRIDLARWNEGTIPAAVNGISASDEGEVCTSYTDDNGYPVFQVLLDSGRIACGIYAEWLIVEMPHNEKVWRTSR